MKITKSILKTMIKKELNLLNEADYTVKPGDSISKIANDEGISVSAILSANSDKFDKTKVSNWKRGDKPGPLDTTSNTLGSRNPNWIYPGETIKLPSSSPASKPVRTGPGRDAAGNIELPSTGDIETVVGTETADEYREDCKDSILAVLNALITTIDGMKERASKSE